MTIEKVIKERLQLLLVYEKKIKTGYEREDGDREKEGLREKEREKAKESDR